MLSVVFDGITSLVIRRLEERRQTTILVDNQVSANDQMGSAVVARTAPNGYTQPVVVVAHQISPSFYPKMSYLPLQDLTRVRLFGHIPPLIPSKVQIAFIRIMDYVAWVKPSPKGVMYASSDADTASHLVIEQFADVRGTPMVHMPYKDVLPDLPDLFAGQVSIISNVVQTSMPQVKAPKSRAWTMTSAKHWTEATHVKTITELGYPQMTGGGWIGQLTPANVSKELLAKLCCQIQKIIGRQHIHLKLMEYAVATVNGTAKHSSSFTRSESSTWAAAIKRPMSSLKHAFSKVKVA
jgi:tripartite-type tricarboxylate transporter receptor subunit TctC